jgi:hypothetical protein
MHHRRSRSDPGDVKDNDPSLDDDESVASDTSSVHTVDLYRVWRLPDLNFSINVPGWFALFVMILLFRGPSSCAE